MNPILSQLNPLYTITPYFFEIPFIIILTYTLDLPSDPSF